MNCMIPLNDDPRYLDEVKRIMVREDVRLVKGDGAVDKFDRMWRDQGVDLHPALQRRIDDVTEAMIQGQTAPGVWQDFDGSCHQDWVTFACFARWYHAITESERNKALEQLAAGNKEPWWVPGQASQMDDMPYACGGSTKDTCCPASVYSDDQYLEHEPEAGPTGSSWMAGLVVIGSMVAAALVAPKLMEKFK